MQGISGRSHSLLLQALNNTAEGSLRLAQRVKIDEKKRSSSFLPFGYYFLILKFLCASWLKTIKLFLINFHANFR